MSIEGSVKLVRWKTTGKNYSKAMRKEKGEYLQKDDIVRFDDEYEK